MKKIVTVFYLLIAGMMFAQNPTFDIQNVTHELGKTRDNMSGMEFYVTANINDYKYNYIKFAGLLQYKDDNGKWVDVPFTGNTPRNYSTNSGQTCATTDYEFYCGSDIANTSQTFFLPYSAITHPSGTVNYRIGFYAYDTRNRGNFLKSKNSGLYHHYYEFGLVWPSQSTSNNTQSNTTHSNNSNSVGGKYETRHEHSNTPNGGCIDVYYYSDGTYLTCTSNPCTFCYGGGVCPYCHGQGQTFVAAGAYSRYVPCYICHMTGYCQHCGGTGVMKMNIWGNSNTGQYTTTTNGGQVFTGVTSNGTAGSSSSTSSSSSSSSKISSTSTSSDKIVYDPDYTGQNVKVWCEKCQKYMYPHKHVKY